jgi:tripartite-type tricarboxylate transporter receptor subunit TctC
MDDAALASHSHRHIRSAFHVIAAIVFSIYGAAAAGAAEYPEKTLRIVVPAEPGGPTDILARAFAEKLTPALGESVIVDNRAGAGGSIGAALVAKSLPDGYTLCWGTTGYHVIRPLLYPKITPYEALRDFAAITLVGQGTNVLVVHPSLPARNVKELISLARTEPCKLNFASSGNGATSHLAGEMFQVLTGTRLTHVPFKGAAPAIVAVISGEVDMATLDMPPLLPHIRSGKMRALAVASLKRSPVLPDVPTLDESGLTDFNASSWHGLFAPARTPREIVVRLNAEVKKVLKTSDIAERLSGLGVEPIGSSPEEFTAFLRSELARFSKVIKLANVKVD